MPRPRRLIPRTKRITVLLTPGELAVLTTRADELNTNISEYIRGWIRTGAKCVAPASHVLARRLRKLSPRVTHEDVAQAAEMVADAEGVAARLATMRAALACASSNRKPHRSRDQTDTVPTPPE